MQINCTNLISNSSLVCLNSECYQNNGAKKQNFDIFLEYIREIKFEKIEKIIDILNKKTPDLLKVIKNTINQFDEKDFEKCFNNIAEFLEEEAKKSDKLYKNLEELFDKDNREKFNELFSKDNKKKFNELFSEDNKKRFNELFSENNIKEFKDLFSSSNLKEMNNIFKKSDCGKNIYAIIESFKKQDIKKNIKDLFNYKDFYSKDKNFNLFLIASTFSSIFIYYYSLIFETSVYQNKKILVFSIVLIPIFMMIFYCFKSNLVICLFRNEFHKFYLNHKILFLLNFILIGLFIYYFQEINKYILKPLFLISLLLSSLLIFNLKIQEKNIIIALLFSILVTGLFILYFYIFYQYILKKVCYFLIFTIIFIVSSLDSYSNYSLEKKIPPSVIFTLILFTILPIIRVILKFSTFICSLIFLFLFIIYFFFLNSIKQFMESISIIKSTFITI